MKCEKCDSPLPEGATFCGICGATAPVQNVPGAQPMYQGDYQPNTYQQQQHNSIAQPLSVGNYLLMFVVMSLPIINLVMLFVWGFGDSNENRKNFARAGLIMIAIWIVISIVLSGIMGALTMHLMESGEMLY